MLSATVKRLASYVALWITNAVAIVYHRCI